MKYLGVFSKEIAETVLWLKIIMDMGVFYTMWIFNCCIKGTDSFFKCYCL